MASSNEELKNKIALANKSIVPLNFENQVKQWYIANKKKVLAWTGSEKKAALFIASAFSECNRIPKLLECTQQSFLTCLVYSMGTNLLPGPMQQCCFLPFSNKGKMEAVFVPMYQGLVTLAYNSGFVTNIWGHVVYEADVESGAFVFNQATNELKHDFNWTPRKERGVRVGAYSAIKNIHNEVKYELLTAEQVLSVKNRSKAAKSSFSPWNSEYDDDIDQMWIKTAFRRNVKWIKKDADSESSKLGRALQLDYQADVDSEPPIELLADEIEEVTEKLLT